MHAAVLPVGRPHAACDHLPRLLSRRHQSATLESNREHVDGMRNVITESGGGDDRGKKSETSESAPPSSAVKSRSAKAGTPQRIAEIARRAARSRAIREMRPAWPAVRSRPPARHAAVQLCSRKKFENRSAMAD